MNAASILDRFFFLISKSKNFHIFFKAQHNMGRRNWNLWLWCGHVSPVLSQRAGRPDLFAEEAWPYETTDLCGPSCSVLPDDKYSWHQITIKACFKVLMTQQLRPVLWGPLKISCLFCCLLALKRLPETKLFNLWALKLSYDPCSLESSLMIAFDHACCEAIMVASPIKGRHLNLLIILWITARLLKWFEEKKT